MTATLYEVKAEGKLWICAAEGDHFYALDGSARTFHFSEVDSSRPLSDDDEGGPDD